MNGYVQSILVIVVVCHVLSLLTPREGNLKKTYRFLCGMVVLAVIALPVRDVAEGIGSMLESWQILEEQNPTDEGDIEEKRLKSSVEEVALGWMRYTSVVYRIPMENMEMTVCASEQEDSIAEIRLYIAGSTALERQQIETELQMRMEAKISVWDIAER